MSCYTNYTNYTNWETKTYLLAQPLSQANSSCLHSVYPHHTQQHGGNRRNAKDLPCYCSTMVALLPAQPASNCI